MNFETFVLLLKGWCIVSAAAVSAFAAGLSQLKMEVVFGVPVPLLSLICNTYATGAMGAAGFLSSTFSDYVTKKRQNGTQYFPNPNVPPSIPKP